MLLDPLDLQVKRKSNAECCEGVPKQLEDLEACDLPADSAELEAFDLCADSADLEAFELPDTAELESFDLLVDPVELEAFGRSIAECRDFFRASSSSSSSEISC